MDPSTIALPPMLRQSLYSYLLPRLASLSALVETVPGVPGLDYPIIAAVPYTNFYCSEMPWPGFYADTEARCQVGNEEIIDHFKRRVLLTFWVARGGVQCIRSKCLYHA